MLQILKESRLFNKCTAQELHEIVTICHTISIKSGEIIFNAKSPAEYLYIVNAGAVEIHFTVKYYNASQKITLEQKNRGDIFGWSALTNPHIYTLSAIAVQNSELIRLDSKDIKELCKANDHLGYVVMNSIAEIIGERFQIVQKMMIEEVQQNLKQKER